MVHSLCASHAWHELTAIIVRLCTSSHDVSCGVTSLTARCTGIALLSSLSDVQCTATGCLHPGQQSALWLHCELEVIVTLPGVAL